MNPLSRLVASRVLSIVVLVLAAVAVVGVFAAPKPTPAEPRSGNGLSDSYQSVQVERLIADLPASEVSPAIAVFSRADGAALGPADDEVIASVSARVAPLALGGAVAPPQPSDDGSVALVVVPLSADIDDAEATDTIAAIRDELADLPDGLRAEVTGGPAFTADINAVFEGADFTLLLATAGVVAVLLLITYRSPVLLVVPLVVIVAGDAAVAQVNEFVLPLVGIPNDPATSGITSVLVFGAATDYALLLIARYRELLRVTPGAREAMVTAVRTTGGAIAASGTTVILAVLTLLLAAVESNQALAISAAVGVVVAMITALVVLPCALVIWGRAAFWPFMPRNGSEAREGGLWGRLGAGVATRPRVVAGVGVVVLAALAAGGLGINTGLSQNEQFRVTPEAVTGAETLATAFPAGSTEPVTITAAPEAVDAVVDAVTAVDGVVSAEPGEGNDQVMPITVVLDAEPGSQASYDSIRALREAVADVPGSQAAVGGVPASTLDLDDAQSRDRQLIIPLILVLVGLVLVVLLRAIVAPVLLMITVVASFFASIGASWLLFSSPLFDFPALDSGVLLLSFVFLVALGVDYNIFLVTRAREEAASTGTRAGMLTALRVTGGVITSAGILLAAVFVVLGVLPIIVLTQIGVIVCIGVLLDTLLVRTVIVPALAFVAGARFWWPAQVDPARGSGQASAGALGGAVIRSDHEPARST